MFSYTLFYTFTPLFSLKAFTLLSDILRLKKKGSIVLHLWLPPAGLRSYPLTNRINNQKTIFFPRLFVIRLNISL